MKIILVNKYARVTGGSDLHCLELAKGLRDRGHEVAFLSTVDDDNLDHGGIFIPRSVSNSTRGETTGINAAGVARRAIWNPTAAAAMKELLSAFRPDVVHAHKLYPQLSVAPIVTASARGIPVVQTVHDYEFISASPIDDTGRWLDLEESRLSYRALNTVLFGIKRLFHTPRVSRWISVSRSTSDAYTEHNIATTVLPNFTQPFKGELRRFADREGIVFIGRLSEEKGLRHILELPEHLTSVPVLIAGDGPLSNEVRRAADVFPSLTYRGKLDRESVAQQLASARVALMPSLWREPGPLSALEAMAAGTPLVAYDNGGLAEYVKDADAGIIVSPSVTSLAAAVASVYDDRARWEKFSSNACHAIQRNHTLAVYLDRLEEIYTESTSLS